MEALAAWQPCKLFVGGLSARTTMEVLHANFSKYGCLVDTVVMSQQGRPRGFGFVTYQDSAAAAAALAEEQWVDGRVVDLKYAVREPPEDRAPNKVFVGGLPQDATTEDLRACFAKYGPIVDAVVMVDRRTKRSRGFGFIRFASGVRGAKAAHAVLMDSVKHIIGDKWVEVKRATPASLTQDLSPSTCATLGAVVAEDTTFHAAPRDMLELQDLHGVQGVQGMRDLQDYRGWESCHQHFWGGAGMDALEADATDAAGQLQRRLSDRRVGRQSRVGLGSDKGMMCHQGSWDHVGVTQAAQGGWNFNASMTSMYAPLPHFHDSSAFDSLGLSATPTDSGSAGGMDSPVASLCGHSSGDEQPSEENRPGAVNRAVTPPGGLKASLAWEVPPMKVECSFSLAGGAVSKDFLEVQPWCFTR